MQNNKYLICIVGPTAIGKTALSIKIANYFSTEIISADSRQFYKEMNIGTAVPSLEELKAAPHHFIQNRSIFEDYNVGDFERDVIELLDSLFNKHQVVVMVGGSGLYVDAVVKGLDKFPEVSNKIKETLKKEYDEFGIEQLQKELKEKDPDYYSKVDLQNHHRVIRALGVCRAQELPYSSFLRTENMPRNFNTLFIGLTSERELIYNRINQRVDIMVKEGLIEEAKKLHENKSLNALQTVGYKELFRYFEGDFSKEEALEEIKKNTRRFAKRQGTWFRKNETITWFDYQTEESKIINFIEDKLPKDKI